MDGSELVLSSGLASVSLYFHVPFCRSKCAYCDFCSFPDAPVRQVRSVLEQTLRQVSHFGRTLQPRRVPTVYVGGGTPSLLTPEQISALLEAARAFGPGPAAGEPREWTVEANPESLSADWLAACREAGVTRISLGLQSLHDPLLAALGRRATAGQGRQALALLDRAWPQARSVDLLAGIPGQVPRELERDIREVADGPCDHISLYTLTPPSGSPLRVDPDAADRLWLGGRRLLERLGYENYEVSNFARRGARCRHNLAYWRLEPYLGVGPAAVSTLPGPGGPLRLSNPADLERFLGGEAAQWGLEAESVRPRDFLLETLLVGLRLRDGIGEPLFVRRFGQPLPRLLPGLWQKWRRRGLARRRTQPAAAYALTEAGRLRLNRLLVEASEALESVDPRLPLRWP